MLPIFCCTAYPSPCCPYTWWEGDSSSTMQRKQHTRVADIPPAVWFGVERCCLARNKQWPPSRASGFLPTAAGVIQPLLRTGMEICTELRGFLSINLADQATGKTLEVATNGWPHRHSQLAETLHAAQLHSLAQTQNTLWLLNQHFPRVIKIPKPAPFLWGWICSVLEMFAVPQTSAGKHGPSCLHIHIGLSLHKQAFLLRS